MQDSLIEDVVVRLVDKILAGTWPSEQRIPTERELTELLGVSRATVRSGIDRLSEWNVLASRQGSGTVVVPRPKWRIGVFPYIMQYCIRTKDWPHLVPMLFDALAMRRAIVIDFLLRAAPHTRAKSLVRSRAACEHAWTLRQTPYKFIAADDLFHLAILEEAGLNATLLFINEIERTYERVIELFAANFVVPENYLETHHAILDALENGDGPGAQKAIQAYFEALDPALLAALPPDLSQEIIRHLMAQP